MIASGDFAEFLWIAGFVTCAVLLSFVARLTDHASVAMRIIRFMVTLMLRTDRLSAKASADRITWFGIPVGILTGLAVVFLGKVN